MNKKSLYTVQDADNLKIHISEVMQLEDAAIAHKMIEDGHTTGKIVLNIE